MSDLVFGHDETIAEWVASQKYGQKFTPPYTAFGIVRNGRLCGGFVFTGHTETAIDISLAGRGVLSRGAWAAVLHYVFEQLNCSRLGCHTRASNKMVRRCLPHLGFKFEGKARRFYGKEDGLRFSLTVDDLAEFRKRWRL